MLDSGKKLPAPPSEGGARSGVPEGAAGLVYNAVVNPDPRTNTLFFAGTSEAMKLIRQYIEQVDVLGEPLMPIEIIPLKHASAAKLEPMLTELMRERTEALPTGQGGNTERRNKVIIKPDVRANALIVSARSDRLADLRVLIAKVDVPGAEFLGRIRTIAIKKSTAGKLADKLNEIWDKRAEVREGGESQLDKPVIVADERSNSLIVAASEEDFASIEKFVNDLESLPLGSNAEIRMIPIQYNSASALVDPLKQLFDARAKQLTPTGEVNPADEVVLQAEPTMNVLLVACSPENFEILSDTVKSLDQEKGIEGQVETFSLKHAIANKVKEALDNLFQDNGLWPSNVGADSDILRERNRVTVVADDRSNVVLVSCSPQNMSVVREIIGRMDAEQPWTPAMTRFFDLVHADAVKSAAILTDYFEQLSQSEGTGNRQDVYVPVTVFADERTNRLVVSADPAGLMKAESLIKKLDVPPGAPSSQFKVYPLKESSAAKIKPMVETLFQERNQPRGQGTTTLPQVPFAIEADELSNALVITASRDDHVLVAGLLEMLDRPSRFMEKVRLFPLEKASAPRAKEMLEELYSGIGQAGGGSVIPISVAVDERINALIVFAPPGEMTSVSELIHQIDATDPGTNLVIRVLPLENADAGKTAELLNEIMTGNLPTEGGGQQDGRAVLVSYFDQDPFGRDLFIKTIRENSSLWSDERTNSVIVMAPPTTVELVEALVSKLDLIRKREVVIKVFKLQNSDADAMVELLERVFAQDEGAQQQEEFQQGRDLQVEGGGSGMSGPTAVSQSGPLVRGTFGRPRATFTPDQRTNSIIVAGWPEDIQVASDIIHQLDSQNVQERVHLVYQVVNMQAPELQTALEQFYQGEVERLGDAGDGISEQVRMAEEVAVVSHEESNQLLISVAPRNVSRVEEIIRALDMPPAQVMIQVLLAEVSIDESIEFGLEYSFQDLHFSETAVQGPNGTVNSSKFDVVGGLDLGAVGSGLGGFTFTIAGEDFNFLLRALHSTGRLEILQRPTIMVQDNQTANITVGQNVPFIRGTQSTGAGQVNSTIEYEEIGVILEVTPNINPDGWVYMEVAPEISSITDSSVPLGNGINAPIFRQQSANTTVAVKDGETVVIGGLIVDSVRSAENKIPILGDIPGAEFLGWKVVRDQTMRNELLIVLTPRVVRTVEDARRLSVEERDRSKITPEMKQNSLFERLRLVPEEEIEPPMTDNVGLPMANYGPTPTARDMAARQVSMQSAPVNGSAYGPMARPQYGPVFNRNRSRSSQPLHNQNGAASEGAVGGVSGR
ncbi:MAG: secretin N-terminal domain-containing protein [Phycisphaerae bacterium]